MIARHRGCTSLFSEWISTCIAPLSSRSYVLTCVLRRPTVTRNHGAAFLSHPFRRRSTQNREQFSSLRSTCGVPYTHLCHLSPHRWRNSQNLTLRQLDFVPSCRGW